IERCVYYVLYRTFVNFVPIKTGQKPKRLVAGTMLCKGVHENRDWTRKRRAAILSFSLPRTHSRTHRRRLRRVYRIIRTHR
ncbi:Uncharacterized protein FWK35_00000169, partial [Aphis craccivora]